MKVTATAIPDVLLIEPTVFGDSRGYFKESYHLEKYRAVGIDLSFVQDNLSMSVHGVVRGLHYQHPHSQGKLVQAVYGSVFDVAVDIRRGSPWFGKWVGFELSEENARQLWVPPGFAHGFAVLTDRALFSYKCADFYDPNCEHTLKWDDPSVGVDWPAESAVLSSKDQGGILLADLPEAALPVYRG